MIIPNYEIIEKLVETKETAIYKAYHKKDPERLLVLKVLKAFFLSNNKLSQFCQRIEHLKVLNNTLVITPTAFNLKDEICFFTQDFFEGVPLGKVLGSVHFGTSLDDFFTIACQLAEALDKIHEAGIIHGGIKPHNILVNPNTLDIRLIDFISTVDVRDVSHFIYDRSFVKNTLAYTSPEQTGRINHRVVFSSDLYSLGVVFYEMLSHLLPFSSDDPLELIHSHLAEEAPEVHKLNPEVPVVLSKIIAKLMLKAPEKRYQSASGLVTDLVRCRSEYAATGSIEEFPLESCGYTHGVTFISKMVGRDREAEIILEEYEQAAGGAFRSLFISGLSGIGKTRLIQELQKPIVMHKGYFTSGKFDVYQKNIPYSSLIQALRNLMRTFLTESDERAAHWKKKILSALGQNGRVLTDVIPELDFLIGPQPEVKPLPPVESLNRFHDLFDRFLTCLASKENPLTLFIDDLQWCDAASFDFLSNIFANYKDHPYLFFLGAYRHNEVDLSHPLTKLIRSVKDDNHPLQEIRLGPLQPQHCHEMVSYILDTPLAQTEALSSFISMLSEGNPLFVSESLSYMYNEDLLFSDEKRQWRWDLEKIRQSDMPNTVVALFGAKIQKLPSDLVNMLEFCACMGNTFSPADIALIKEMTITETFEKLKPALGQGLLTENKNKLQFIHDKVQEATLSNISESRRCQIHWQIGNHLFGTIPEGAQEIEKLENLFAIVSHLNMGRESNPDSKTAYRLSDFNYHAGNKALDSLATEAANEYFHLSRELLPADCWEEDQYERTFRIFQKAAKTELMCGHYENSERLLTELLDHAKTDLDKAECLAEQTSSLSSIGNFIKAIETANRGLAYFDKAIPDSSEEADQRRQELMREIAEQKIDVWETILNMPFTTDRKSKIELAFYSELIPDLYMSGLVSQLYLAAAQSTQHCLSGGMDESVIYSFNIMGLQLGEQEKFDQAFKYEDLARDLSAKYPNTFGATRGMNGIVWCNMHSRSHPQEIIAYCLKSIQSGKNCGDLYNAGLSYGPLMWNLQAQGANLSLIEDYARECLQFSNRYHLSFSVSLAEAMQAGWIAPMKKDYEPIGMEEKLKAWERENYVASAGSYYVHMGLTHYYCGDYEKAQEYLIEVRRYLSGLTDNVLKRQWHVFLVLNALKMHEKGKGADKQELLSEIQPIIKKVENWARLGPLLKPYLALLYAELARVTGTFKEARSLYLDAINAAHEQHYTFLAGYLNECLGELILTANLYTERVYLAEAARLYKKCGAQRKEIKLIEKYPQYFEEEKSFKMEEHSNLQFEVDSTCYTLPNLDINYLMKSSLAISAEMEQEALLKKIMNVVIESSGAQSGYLLIEEEGSLFIQAESHIGEKQVQTVNQKLDDAVGICKAIIRYVYRTGERVILDNASKEGMFKDNREVQELQLNSVLCLPVLKQTRMIGILYLENSLSNGVFTAKKIQMTEMLTFQAAISLENSRLVREDITERKRAEDKLRAASLYARSLIEASLDPLVTISPEGKITDVNEATIKVTGIPRDRLVGTDFSDYFTEPDKAREGYEQVFEKGYVTDYPLTIRHKNGNLVDVLYNASVYKDAIGNALGAFAAARDVSAQRQASQYARSLIEASLDPLVTISPEGKIMDVNEATVKVTGIPRDRLIETDFSDYFTEPDRAREGYQKVFEKGYVTDYPLTIRNSDGNLVDVLYNASVYKDIRGNVLGAFAAARDVTEQRQASQYARSLIEASLDPLVTISPEGKITDVNEATVKVTGVPRDKLVGTVFSDYFTEPDKAREGYQKVFEKGFVTDYPLTIRNSDGNLVDVLYNASIYRDIRGNVLGVFAAARDVTAQNQASQYARSLIEASLDPLVTISPEGKITDVNEATVKVTGVPRDRLVGTDFSDYFTEPDKAREGYQKVFEKGFVTDYPLTIRNSDGNLVDVLYNASVYKDLRGNVLGVFAAARDVTESKLVMREFAETKNFLDNILESSTKYSIIGKDLNHRILSWNEGAVRNYGYTAEQIIGQDSSILHSPEDLRSGEVDKMLVIAYEEGLAEGEFQRVRKDGSRFIASVVVTRRNDSAGNPIGFLLMSNDISEKKEAEGQLRQTFQYARSLIEASLDPLVTISPEGKITDVNEAAVKVTGVPRDNLVGTDFSDYFTESEKAREGYQQVFEKGFVTDYPLTIRDKDGRLMDVLYNASVYRDMHDNVLGVFAAARDVTAQRQAAQYARSLIEASLDPLVTISPEGKITDANEATVKVTGIPQDRLIGTDFSDYFTEPDKARKGYEQVFSKGFVTDYPLTIRHKDGRLTDVLYNASEYRDVQGNVLGVFAAARDVTAQKEAEVKIAGQRAREEQRTRELERLAELERFQKLTVGRELKMIELKKEIEELQKEIALLQQVAQAERTVS